MFIQTQETPNPATVKFIPGQEVLQSGTVDISSREQAALRSPLAQRLFSIVGVVRVFLATDFISVTKADDTDWSMLKPMILAALMEHLSTGQPVLRGAPIDHKIESDEPDDEITTQIKELLEARVRPMVAMDGGDIIFDRYEDGIVFLQMQGACAGCPSSTATLKMGIENMLRHYIPEIKEVRPSEMY